MNVEQREAALELLERQLGIAWGLLDYHLERLVDDDLHWAPVDNRWSIRRMGDSWVPDWADVEPTPLPVPTAAWVTWHIGWWWSTALTHLTGDPVPSRDDVRWPGGAESTRNWLRSLHSEWRTALAEADDLAEISRFPWPADLGYTVADMCAWANVELMKNAAELGQLTMIRNADG